MLESETIDVIELMYEAGWTDGLPVVPPTREKVQKFVDYVQRDETELIAEVPPRGGRATIEKLAINSVLAGCRPEYFPVVIAAVEASMDDGFNWRGHACSTGGHTPLLIINGPITTKLDINGGFNAFGQGWRANATIGRAYKLIMWNIGEAKPGLQSKACQSSPAKYSFCVAENEAASPWEPLHVELGFAPGDSTVTVFACEAPNDIFYSGTARGLLHVCADRLSSSGVAQMGVMAGDIFLAFGPEHAKMLAADGWNKTDIRAFLFEHARRPLCDLHREDPISSRLPKWMDPTNPAECRPVVRKADDIYMFLAGGPGGMHSAALPGWGSRKSIRKITEPE
jgi:hypothetical protein